MIPSYQNLTPLPKVFTDDFNFNRDIKSQREFIANNGLIDLGPTGIYDGSHYYKTSSEPYRYYMISDIAGYIKNVLDQETITKCDTLNEKSN